MKPRIDRAFLERLWRYRERPGNDAGGALHVVVDNGNTSNDSLLYCEGVAEYFFDYEGAQLARELMQMSKTQRRKVARHFYDKP